MSKRKKRTLPSYKVGQNVTQWRVLKPRAPSPLPPIPIVWPPEKKSADAFVPTKGKKMINLPRRFHRIDEHGRKRLIIERRVVRPDQNCNYSFPPELAETGRLLEKRTCQTKVTTLAIYLNFYITVYASAGELVASWRYCDAHGGVARAETEYLKWLEVNGAEPYEEKTIRNFVRQVKQGKLRRKDLPWT